MKDVMEGNLDGVAEKLNQQPELMRCQMKWVDYAGRVFPKITPFQLAVWYGDWHMWDLMRDPKEVKQPLSDKHAALQYHALKQHSKEVSGENGPKYSFKIMLDAYAKTERLFNEKKYDECNQCFVKEVGGAQRSAPYWYQYLMSEAGYCDWTRQAITEHSGKKGGKGKRDGQVRSIFSSNESGENWAVIRCEVNIKRGDKIMAYLWGRSEVKRRWLHDSECCTKCDQTMNQTESKLEKSLALTTGQLSIAQHPKGVESNSNMIQFN